MREWIRLIFFCGVAGGLHALLFLYPVLTQERSEETGEKGGDEPPAKQLQAQLRSQLEEKEESEEPAPKDEEQPPPEPEEKEEKKEQTEKDEKEDEDVPERVAGDEQAEPDDVSGTTATEEPREEKPPEQTQDDQQETPEESEETEQEEEEQPETDEEKEQQEDSSEESESIEDADKKKSEADQDEKESEEEVEEGVNADATTEEAEVAAAEESSSSQAKDKKLREEYEKVRKAAKKTVTVNMSDAEYRQYMQDMEMSKVQGRDLPKLVFAYKDVNEILSSHRFFDMRIVALHPSNPSTVVEVRGLGSSIGDSSARYQKIQDFNWDEYSNRVSRRTASFFEGKRKEIIDRGLLPSGSGQESDDIILVSITPNNSDAYFSHKQLENLKKQEIEPENVRATIGRFYKTSKDTWILAIESMQMANGDIKDIQDFEMQKLQGGG